MLVQLLGLLMIHSCKVILLEIKEVVRSNGDIILTSLRNRIEYENIILYQEAILFLSLL